MGKRDVFCKVFSEEIRAVSGNVNLNQNMYRFTGVGEEKRAV